MAEIGRRERELEAVIGYSFRNPALLRRALTRLAYAKEQGLDAADHMDALATLGDAVFELATIESLVQSGETEKGAITNQKVNRVNMVQLRRVAESLRIERYVYWGRGEEGQHIWTSGRVLAECIEAVIGAVYLDGGMAAARQVLEHLGFLGC
ncbi:MAG: ribonuclease III domain-containing protein [Methanomicrobiales archaeon]|nr:ribonuclease III domain-containing protein [Methanomicrobiales archaeon]MDI6876758.1 ribonuclease III domain-containing protein [Methanomicrobiales archaeon]